MSETALPTPNLERVFELTHDLEGPPADLGSRLSLECAITQLTSFEFFIFQSSRPDLMDDGLRVVFEEAQLMRPCDPGIDLS